ncbi:MAG: hypothetical protein ACKVS8_14115 [Phycisphaerales bacterium]
MSTYPTSPRADFLAWARTHAGVFVGSHTQIGLTEAQALAFQAAVDEAQAAVAERAAAIQAAMAATNNANLKVALLQRAASITVEMIRTFAQSSENPAVYPLAQIPAPATRSAAPPPAKPRALAVELNNASGTLTLKWKATNPASAQGTSYIIRRKLPGQSAFVILGVSGVKRFVDESLPAGLTSVQYVVQGQRADLSGPESNPLVVNFGTSAGALVASGEQAMKLAA